MTTVTPAVPTVANGFAYGRGSALAPSNVPSLASSRKPTSPPQAPTGGHGGAASGAGLLRIASINAENMFDTIDDPAPANDTVVSEKDYQRKLSKLSLAIRDVFKGPEIIAFEEIENEGVLRDLASQAAIKDLGYQVAIMPTNDVRNINVAVMYRPDAVKVGKVWQHHPDAPSNLGDNPTGQLDMDKLYARAPLAVNFEVLGGGSGTGGATDARAGAKQLTVIVNHFKSKLGGDKPEARRVMQGVSLGEFVDELREKNPNVPVVATGDFNALWEDGAYKKLVTRADGTKRFDDTLMTVPEEDRYTYIYKGQKNALDHMLVTGDMFAAHTGTEVAHINSGKDNPRHANDPKVPNGYSDHDVMIASFDISKLPSA